MSIYVVPALNAVDFALTSYTPADLTPSYNELVAYTPPALNAVDFALVAYTVPTYPYIGWELLPGGFPTQYSGLRVYYSGATQDLCLVAEGDAPSGMGGVFKILKNTTNYAVYLVETTDPLATPVRLNTTAGIKAIRIKT